MRAQSICNQASACYFAIVVMKWRLQMVIIVIKLGGVCDRFCDNDCANFAKQGWIEIQ